MPLRFILPAQTELRIFVGVCRHDFAEVDAVGISPRVGFVEDSLRERVGEHVVAVYGAALIVHKAFLDNGRKHLAGLGAAVRCISLNLS